MEQIRVGLVEDEAVMRGMLEQTISSQEGMTVVHTAAGASEAMKLFQPGTVDVAILDVHLQDGNGVTLGAQLQRNDPHLSIMLLSAIDVLGLFETIQKEVSRPWSYLSKRSSFARDVLINAIKATANGEVVIDPYLVQRSEPRAGTNVSRLTPTQFSVLRLIAEGLSNEAAAEQLGINPRSVESHLAAIYQRLELESEGKNRRVAAVLAFLEQTGRTWR